MECFLIWMGLGLSLIIIGKLHMIHKTLYVLISIQDKDLLETLKKVSQVLNNKNSSGE